MKSPWFFVLTFEWEPCKRFLIEEFYFLLPGCTLLFVQCIYVIVCAYSVCRGCICCSYDLCWSGRLFQSFHITVGDNVSHCFPALKCMVNAWIVNCSPVLTILEFIFIQKSNTSIYDINPRLKVALNVNITLYVPSPSKSKHSYLLHPLCVVALSTGFCCISYRLGNYHWLSSHCQRDETLQLCRIVVE